MASKKIGTRGNPSSPLNPGVSDPEELLRETRRNLVSTSSEKFKLPDNLEIPEAASFPIPSLNPQSEKGREELDLLFTPLKVDNLRVFTNPLIPEQVKLESRSLGSTLGITSSGTVAGERIKERIYSLGNQQFGTDFVG